MYNLTNITNANTILTITDAVNQRAGGGFILTFQFMLLIIYMIVFKKQDFKISLLGGSFFAAIVGVYFYVIQWIAMSQMMIMVLVFFASILLVVFGPKD